MIASQTKEGIILRVRLSPNSCCCKVLGTKEDSLKISVTSIPEDGKANAELIKFLSKKLRIAKSNFEIIKGFSSKDKQILINNTDIEQILELANDN